MKLESNTIAMDAMLDELLELSARFGKPAKCRFYSDADEAEARLLFPDGEQIVVRADRDGIARKSTV